MMSNMIQLGERAMFPIVLGVLLVVDGTVVATAQAPPIASWSSQSTINTERTFVECVGNHRTDWGNACANAGATFVQACEDEGHPEAACKDVAIKDALAIAGLQR